MRLINTLAILEGLSTTFHNISYVFHHLRRIQVSSRLKFASAFPHCSQDYRLLGVAQHGQIRIVGCNDDLPTKFHARQNVHDDLADESVVQIVFRLVYQ